MAKIGGIYQGCRFSVCPQTDYWYDQLDFHIFEKTLIGFTNKIMGLFMFPSKFFTYEFEEDLPKITNKLPIVVYRYAYRPNDYWGYVPKNKKLFTHPYMFLSVDGLSSQKSFMWEKSLWHPDGGSGIPFEFYGCISLNPCINCVPIYNMDSPNITESFIVSASDELTVYSESFINLFGKNGIIRAGLNIATMMEYGMPLGELLPSGENNVKLKEDDLGGKSAIDYSGGDELSKSEKISLKREESGVKLYAGHTLINSVNWKMNSLRGRNGDASADYVTGKKDVYFKSMGIKKEFAEKIDKFFDAYGYAVNTIKTPTIKNRPHWTYVKTKGCIVGGAIPDKYRSEICSIFDGGIRFWVAGGTVTGDPLGNYDLDNRPFGT